MIFTNFGQLLCIYIQNERLFLYFLKYGTSFRHQIKELELYYLLLYYTYVHTYILQIYRVNELTHKCVFSVDDNLCRYLLSDPRLPAEARMASIAVMLVASMVTSSLVVVLVTSWPHAAAALVGHQLEEDRSPHTQTPAQVSTSRGRTATQPPEPEPGDRRVMIMVTLGNGTL